MRFIHEGNIHFTFSLGKTFPLKVWKIMIPLILLVTFCICVLHWVGVI